MDRSIYQAKTASAGKRKRLNPAMVRILEASIESSRSGAAAFMSTGSSQQHPQVQLNHDITHDDDDDAPPLNSTLPQKIHTPKTDFWNRRENHFHAFLSSNEELLAKSHLNSIGMKFIPSPCSYFVADDCDRFRKCSKDATVYCCQCEGSYSLSHASSPVL
jgi:hypothetical protein